MGYDLGREGREGQRCARAEDAHKPALCCGAELRGQGDETCSERCTGRQKKPVERWVKSVMVIVGIRLLE